MIRHYEKNDLDAVLDIWLKASIKAHDFVAPAFWEAQLDSLRNIYIPASESYIYEQDASVSGFYSLSGDSLAAIFVYPHLQGQGIGKQLIAHAKSQRSELTLTVYKENVPSYQFYLSQGFHRVNEKVDEHTGHIECLMSIKT